MNLKNKLAGYKRKIEQALYGIDIYYISFPKTGRTWLRVMIGKYLCGFYGLPEKYMFDTYKLTRIAKLPTIEYSHDNSGYSNQKSLAWHQLKFNDIYKNKRVIFQIRNIKDTLVSNYFQATRRALCYKDTISKFIRDNRYGVKKLITFYNMWHDNQKVPQDFLLIRYEDIHKQPESCFSQVLDFINIPNAPHLVEKAIEFSSFDNMRRLEEKHFFAAGGMRQANPNDSESHKLRRGIIKGYVDYLNQDDIGHIDHCIKEMYHAWEFS